MSQEDDLGFGDKFANLSGGVNPVQTWEADVQQNQIWSQLYCLLNRFQSVGHSADDLQIAPCGQRRGDELQKGCKILDDENTQ